MSLIFRLHDIIKNQLAEVNGNLAGLHKKIQDANAKAEEKGNINSKTLEKVARRPKEVHLSYSNFIALQNYLGPKGLGLDVWPVLDRTGLLHCLAETKNV